MGSRPATSWAISIAPPSPMSTAQQDRSPTRIWSGGPVSRQSTTSCCAVDIGDGGAIEIAQDVAGLEPIKVRVVAHGLGPDPDPGEVLGLLEQTQGSLRVDSLGDRDGLVRRAVEAERRLGRT